MKRNWLNPDALGVSSLRVAAIAALYLAWLSPPIFAQRSPCSPGVPAVEDHPFGYPQRDNRCEGIYWQPHMGASGEIWNRRAARRGPPVRARVLCSSRWPGSSLLLC